MSDEFSKIISIDIIETDREKNLKIKNFFEKKNKKSKCNIKRKNAALSPLKKIATSVNTNRNVIEKKLFFFSVFLLIKYKNKVSGTNLTK
jgi:hypothetical protein